MRLVVTGFIVGSSNSTDPDNTGSAQNTQIILFKVLDLVFTWIFFSSTYLNGYCLLFCYSSVTDFFKKTFSLQICMVVIVIIMVFNIKMLLNKTYYYQIRLAYKSLGLNTWVYQWIDKHLWSFFNFFNPVTRNIYLTPGHFFLSPKGVITLCFWGEKTCPYKVNEHIHLSSLDKPVSLFSYRKRCARDWGGYEDEETGHRPSRSRVSWGVNTLQDESVSSSVKWG